MGPPFRNKFPAHPPYVSTYGARGFEMESGDGTAAENPAMRTKMKGAIVKALRKALELTITERPTDGLIDIKVRG
jgi:hypothetical protein